MIHNISARYLAVKHSKAVVFYPVAKVYVPAVIIQLKVNREMPVAKNEKIIMLFFEHIPCRK